ncbi:MAG: M20 family metallopeptidase, partial [Armatimonadetes bacterium]|nr:M20 family metallopeptidase [Armatimonadota bacterium]
MTTPSAWIDARRDEILSFLGHVVEIESPSEHKAGVDAVGAVFAKAYEALGLRLHLERQTQYGDHLIAESTATSGPRVLLVGHMDTVYPVGTTARRPFTVRDGIATGPAVNDMKGGLTVMLWALRSLAETGRPIGPVRVVQNSDEEPGSPTSRDGWPARAADCDCAFILEPAGEDDSLVDVRKGVGIFRFSVTGRAAHAGAEPEKGANAILALAHHAIALSAAANPAAGTTVNVGVIGGGTWPYVVPAEAWSRVDVRVSTKAEAQRIFETFGAIARRAPVANTTAKLEGFFHRPPLEPAPGTDALKAIVDASAREVGLAPVYLSTGGASDGNNIAAAGVPTIDGMGPAGAGAHS